VGIQPVNLDYRHPKGGSDPVGDPEPTHKRVKRVVGQHQYGSFFVYKIMSQSSFTLLCNALKKEDVVRFVHNAVKSGYQEFFIDHSEQISVMLDNAFELLMRSQSYGTDRKKLLETTRYLTEKVFKKDDDSFWFNQIYRHYRQHIQPENNFRQFQEFILGNTVLDFGSGSGCLALQMVRKGYKVYTTDVIDYRFGEAQDIPFLKMESPTEIPYSKGSIDTAIALAVLHHIDGENIPKILMSLSKTANRLLLKEDTFNLPPILKIQQEQLRQPLLNYFTDLSLESQYQSLILLDFFANAIALGVTEMNFPFQFKGISEWSKLLNANGWQITKIKLTGLEEHRMHKSCQAWIICERLPS
jgi:SAM-dependent methyltransferase